MSVRKHLEVVCGIIVFQGKVLATRRDPSRELPLLWEFPGGKLEDGEAPEEALHRELEEELGIRVQITQELDPVEERNGEYRIRLLPFICQLDQEAAPVPVDHSEIRWMDWQTAQQLTWAPADIPLVAQLKDFIS